MTSLFIERPTTDCLEEALKVIETPPPRQSDLTMALIRKLHPQVAVTGVAYFEAITSSVISCGLMNIHDYSNLTTAFVIPAKNNILQALSLTIAYLEVAWLIAFSREPHRPNAKFILHPLVQ
ncbi:hypothetical protein Nepgr_029982 [Nepenthes gracilis]|uniref:Uncharacterized protein n=1 Tax=Nepenthes gracilis TaxID=150966 RepID=A0AAD3Y5M9_NEPGR|nr:hypothetical protein Nepgr_029982 [Nepenthes gracilis]